MCGDGWTRLRAISTPQRTQVSGDQVMRLVTCITLLTNVISVRKKNLPSASPALKPLSLHRQAQPLNLTSSLAASEMTALDPGSA